MTLTKSSLARLRNSLARAKGRYDSADITLKAQIKSGHLPPQAKQWLQEIHAKQNRPKASMPNPDMPRYTVNRTPQQRELAQQRALAKRKEYYRKSTWKDRS